MQQVVIAKAQSVHVDATLKVTVNVENAEAPCQEQGAVLKTGEVEKPAHQEDREAGKETMDASPVSTLEQWLERWVDCGLPQRRVVGEGSPPWKENGVSSSSSALAIGNRSSST